MQFDSEGHLLITPREVQDMAIADRTRLINSVLLPGTPIAIPTHAQHFQLLHHIADGLGIHPNNLFFKGSTKIGFSIKPKIKKVWMEYGPPSDLDLAIVDTNFFHIVDYEVGRWEWNPDNRGRMFRDQRLLREYKDRAYQKGKYDCFRFFDLPKIPSMGRLYECLESAPIEASCGLKRTLKAFIFRDWWAVCKRYDYDIHCLLAGLKRQERPFPAGSDAPHPYEEIDEEDEGADEYDSPAAGKTGAIRKPTAAQAIVSEVRHSPEKDLRCATCGTELQLEELGFSYICPKCSLHSAG